MVVAERYWKRPRQLRIRLFIVWPPSPSFSFDMKLEVAFRNMHYRVAY